MSYTDNLLKALDVPQKLPRRMRHAQIEISYSPKAVDDDLPTEQLEEVGDTLQNLASLCQQGFLASLDSKLEILRPAADRLTITLSGTELDRNLLVLLLRIIHNQHQTPEEAWQQLLRALGNEAEAREVYGGVEFPEVISRISIRAEGDGLSAFDPLHPVVGDFEIEGLPQHEILDAEEITVPACAPPSTEVEDAWLMLSCLGAFLPLEHEPDYEPGEESFFARGRDLIVSDISVEPVWLAALFRILGHKDGVVISRWGDMSE